MTPAQCGHTNARKPSPTRDSSQELCREHLSWLCGHGEGVRGVMLYFQPQFPHWLRDTINSFLMDEGANHKVMNVTW